VAPDDHVVALPLDAHVAAAVRGDVGLQDESVEPAIPAFDTGGRLRRRARLSSFG
jgi:hypothetical protein